MIYLPELSPLAWKVGSLGDSSLPFLTETRYTCPVWSRVNRVNSGGAGGAAAEPANCGGWWKLRAALGKGRPRFHLLPNAPPQPRPPLTHAQGTLHSSPTPTHPYTAHPGPAGPLLPGAGWRHPASSRTPDDDHPGKRPPAWTVPGRKGSPSGKMAFSVDGPRLEGGDLPGKRPPVWKVPSLEGILGTK